MNASVVIAILERIASDIIVVNEFYITEELRNTDLFAAVFLGLTAIIFAVRAELKGERTMIETRGLQFVIVLCAIIAILLAVRIAAVTIVFFSLLLSHI